MIENLQDLCDHLGATHGADIPRAIYEMTESGCSVGVDSVWDQERYTSELRFSVSGYCESSDHEFEPHIVTLPCEPQELFDAIGRADADGEAEWDNSHGCPDCHPDGYCDEWGNEWSPEEDNWVGQPINKNCAACNGHGAIL